MKLLFDENLSHKLARLLEDLFPNSVHVRDVGLKAADDPLVWELRKEQCFCHRVQGRGHASAKFSVWPSSESSVGTLGELFDVMWKDFRCKHYYDQQFLRDDPDASFSFYPKGW